MGWSWSSIPVKEAVERAMTMRLVEKSTPLPWKIVPDKVVKAEIREDHRAVRVYYKNQDSYWAYKKKPPELFQQFEVSGG